MARPSLPAAIAPFRGCPAGCLRVACETLLSPSAQKGRMNNGPRQALALNNPSLCFTLCFTFSVSKSNHKLFPQSTHSFIHPIYCPSEAGSCYLKVLACIYPIHLSLPQTLSSLLLVNTQRHTVNQHEREQEAPHIFQGSQDLM